jgi:hypothetical protein
MASSLPLLHSNDDNQATVIASAATQSSLAVVDPAPALDCFAALAMTVSVRPPPG